MDGAATYVTAMKDGCAEERALGWSGRAGASEFVTILDANL